MTYWFAVPPIPSVILREVRVARRIEENIPENILLDDLERYRQKALDMGASDALAIDASIVPIDDRVRIKCTYPKCDFYGTNRNCPPYAIDLAESRRMVDSFRHAVLFRLVVPIETVAGERSTDDKRDHRRNLMKRADVVSAIESEAFYDGHYLAVGFAGGPCKGLFCPKVECAALTPGQPCRRPLQARSAMEAIGIDVYLLAAKVGWDIYPIGSRPTDAPHGNALGIVFID